MHDATRHAHDQTACWLDKFVIGLNLCPFAAKPRAEHAVRIQVSTATDMEHFLEDFVAELNTLIQSDEAEIATTLLVAQHCLADFEDYLDAADFAQQIIEQTGLEGEIQVATFHPDYLFEGEPLHSTSHYTNRSPFPMLHLIREAQMEAALAHYPDAENIPQRNIEKLESLKKSGINDLIAQCRNQA